MYVKGRRGEFSEYRKINSSVATILSPPYSHKSETKPVGEHASPTPRLPSLTLSLIQKLPFLPTRTFHFTHPPPPDIRGGRGAPSFRTKLNFQSPTLYLSERRPAWTNPRLMPMFTCDEGFHRLNAHPVTNEGAIRLKYLLKREEREKGSACYSVGFISSMLQSRSWMT